MREASSNDIKVVKKYYRAKVKELEKDIRKLENEVKRLTNLLNEKGTASEQKSQKKKEVEKEPETPIELVKKIKDKIQADQGEREALIERVRQFRKKMPVIKIEDEDE